MSLIQLRHTTSGAITDDKFFDFVSRYEKMKPNALRYLYLVGYIMPRGVLIVRYAHNSVYSTYTDPTRAQMYPILI